MHKSITLVRVWVIRFGNFGEFADECKNKGVIVIGWNKIGDLSSINTKDDLREKLYKSYPENYKRVSSAGVAAGMLWQFSRELSPGDIVISPRKDTREILVGTVENSKYVFDPHLINREYPHVRRVKWKITLSYDEAPREIWKSMTAWQTLFELSSPEAISSANSLISGTSTHQNSQVNLNEEIKNFYFDVKEKTKEFIIKHFDKLEGYEFQELVRQTLKAAGLYPKPTKKGRDGGIDIEAYRDPLQLGPDRIIIQVKHRDGQVSGPEMREFKGALGEKDIGLYVSTGGFKPDAKAEAAKRSPPIRLMGWEDFISLFLEVYDKLDNEAKAMVPLEVVYILHPVGESEDSLQE